MDCRQLLFVVCAVVLQLSGVECQKTCPDAPATAEDRRTDKSVVKIASYNMYWLFDGKSDPNPVPWTSWQSAYSHAKHMAKEIERINADIYVLVEVEDCSILDYVIDQMTDKTLYKRYLVQGTDSSTGQDVALLTKIDPITPLTRSKDYVNYPLPGSKCTDKTTGSTGVSKNFATTIRISENPEVNIGVMGVHLLAQPTNTGRCAKREAQAKIMADYAKQLFDASVANGTLAGYFVMGDYNEFSNEVLDVHDSVPISMAMDNIRDAGVSSTGTRLFEVASLIPKIERYTYGTGSLAELIDHIVISEPLKDLIVDGSSYIDHRESASKANGGSDHWCFVTTLRTGVSADECTSSPCGSGQTCKDLSLANTGDFTCTCKPEFGSISSYGSSAICELDECTLPGMCKELFSCTDRNTSIASRDDVTCSCRSADCKSRDECKNSPCGIDQTCMDPTFNLTKGDFVCTCNPQFGSISSIGQQAVCEYDECGLYPCTAGQTCNDANTSVASLNDFSCSGGMPPVSADECLMTPCGANQVCVEVNNTISGDFICRCSTTVGNIASIGSPAVCTYDECLTTPCSTGQACQDANESIASLGDFVCTNTSSISNECEPSPCGVGQMCIDSDWSMAGDFICKCDMSLGNIASIGSSAFCTFDECTNNPCPSGKTCTDSNSSTASLGDYTCSNSGSVVNECVATPCSAGQTCSDPDWAVSKNFICMCGADALNIAAIGMDAICTLDECQNNPCSGSQTCVDTNTSITSLGDFTCSSSSSSVDECLSSPCGGSQSCSDPNMTTSGDFICRCDPSSGNIAAFAAPAMCTFDECQNNPCPTGQSCTDGNTSTISLGDYSCSNSQSVLNECLAGPCASGQTCSDPDWSTPRDFICKCGAEIGNVAAVGASASCVFDECQSTPCSVGQTCLDANMSVASLGNYACSGSQAGTDECSTSPCDAGQMCTDLDTSSSGNYICKCPGKFGSQIASVGQSASCTYDECGLSPCMMGETCADKNISSSSLGDFTCSGSTSVDECASSPCDSQQECSDMNKNSDLDFICKCPTQFGNIAAIGSAAVCSYDECSTTPCPSPQLCTDLNQSIASIGDFSCRSASDSFDECQTTPCGDGQGCSDPNLKQTGDYKCTCTSISLGTSTVGKPANCSINECISTPCGAKQMCEDNNMLMMNDYTCSCMNTTYGDMMVSGKPANCSFDECTKSPCGVSQTCNDPNEEIYLDFTCTCDMSLGLISETGKEALCVTNECNTFPCESDEACLDKNISSVSMKDFMCVKQSSTTNMLDECSLGICPDDQTCMDPDMTQSYDFECTCHQDYGLVNATGKAAICMMDECESKPCGNDSCKDSNMSVVSLNDFVCSKMNESNPYCKGTTCTDCAVHSTYLKTLLNLDQSDATLVVPGTVTCPDTAALAASAPSNSSGDDSKEKVYLIILIVEAVLLFIALAALAYKCMSGNKITDDGSFDHDSMLPTNNWEELSQPPSPAHSSSRQLITL